MSTKEYLDRMQALRQRPVTVSREKILARLEAAGSQNEVGTGFGMITRVSQLLSTPVLLLATVLVGSGLIAGYLLLGHGSDDALPDRHQKVTRLVQDDAPPSKALAPRPTMEQIAAKQIASNRPMVSAADAHTPLRSLRNTSVNTGVASPHGPDTNEENEATNAATNAAAIEAANAEVTRNVSAPATPSASKASAEKAPTMDSLATGSHISAADHAILSLVGPVEEGNTATEYWRIGCVGTLLQRGQGLGAMSLAINGLTAEIEHSVSQHLMLGFFAGTVVLQEDEVARSIKFHDTTFYQGGATHTSTIGVYSDGVTLSNVRVTWLGLTSSYSLLPESSNWNIRASAGFGIGWIGGIGQGGLTASYGFAEGWDLNAGYFAQGVMRFEAGPLSGSSILVGVSRRW